MSKSIEQVVDRVRKLLAVSKSDNEHEAAQAAARAARLVEEYQLTEAMLRVEDTSRAAEPIHQDAQLPEAVRTQRKVAWRIAIASAVAKRHGCRIYFSNRQVRCFGREGATQAWSYTCEYLFREVERLADERWEDERNEAMAAGHSPRAWKNSFRVGAAQAIAVRLADETREAQARRFTHEVADAPVVESAANAPVTASPHALAILEQDEREVESEYAKFSSKFRTARSIGRVSARDGYRAGREAGREVRLGGGRGALGAGQGVLR